MATLPTPWVTAYAIVSRADQASASHQKAPRRCGAEAIGLIPGERVAAAQGNRYRGQAIYPKLSHEFPSAE